MKPTVTAILGPTNTGKTFFAMERMLAHSSGMIGFPLRLLARENYDRAVAQKGVGQVALITGEEKIMPPGARYYLCTLEAMPMDEPVAFLALDEVQMCADPDRGHVFTDRLLNARGQAETLFLGSESMKPMIKRLVPEAEFVTRPRMSTLSYAGSKKINRLPPRSAVVAFTINDVYAIAELIRRQRGGAAVVLGALSPRTRNAQVAMYQAGEVDYLVATDAIGMGLNMDVHHVAFASTRKFDGRRFRQLTPEELGQTAGRAGRHTNDGTFGVTANVEALDMETIQRIENHSFDQHRQIFWRKSDLPLNTLEALRAALREHSGQDGLIRVREAADERALNELSRDSDIADSAMSRDGTEMLWDVCQIPDFEKEWTIGHARLLDRIYRHLRLESGKLPNDWIADHVNRIERFDGDIDALSNRISRIRTWTYISHKSDWIEDFMHWQERTREIEDRLSDALHERLMQRFVDKRTALLVSKLNSQEDLIAAVRADGDVLVEGQFVGQLIGLQFVPDEVQFEGDRRALAGAAAQVIRQEITRRIKALATLDELPFQWNDNGGIDWMGEPIARLKRGNDMMHPIIALNHNDNMDAPQREKLTRTIELWMRAEIDGALKFLIDLNRAKVKGAARGVVFQLGEYLGSMDRGEAADQIDALSTEDRRALKSMGIRIGRSAIYMPALLKPAAIAIRTRLWNLWHGPKVPFTPPKPGLITVELSGQRSFAEESAFLKAVGYPVFREAGGAFAVRLDMLERIAGKAWTLGLKKPFAMDETLMSYAGAGLDRTTAILHGLGFVSSIKGDVRLFRLPRRKSVKKPATQKVGADKKKATAAKQDSTPTVDADSPFAVLKGLKIPT
ncbi:MAG: disulfide oxidoreductase [Rhodospirillales bacterium]|jgi:ATP-dependent RNA helicase SUPV3L1/SUV3|nr:disulfide oxidoreductase [Rhodospirillales bacterium]MBT6109486.1 disulfide oxidoreductase [Rhodospirillales bacterium]